MIIFIYGTDAYRLKQARENIIGEYRKKYRSGINVSFFDFRENYGTENLSEFVRSSSFFSDHKLAVLAGAFSKKTIAENILDIIKHGGLEKSTEVTILFAENGADKELVTKSKELFKVVSANIVKTFEPLIGSKLSNWITQEISDRGCSIGQSAVRRLIESCGNDSWVLINEIEKITAYRKAGEITEGDIDKLVPSTRELNIFDLTDAITFGNKSAAAQLLHLTLASGKDPYYLLALITGQFRSIIMVRDLAEKNESQAGIAKKTGMHPYVIKKIFQNSNTNMEKLGSKYKDLLNIEMDFKNGKSNLTDSLFKFIFSQ